MYFGPEQENQVRHYLETLDGEYYKNHIHKLLRKIAIGVGQSKGWHKNPYYRSDAVVGGCVSLLWEKLASNYEPQKGRKAYSYLTTIAQNYYRNVRKKVIKEQTTLYKTGKEIEWLWDCANEPALTWNIDGQVGSVEKFLIQKDEENENLRAAFRALTAYENKNDNSKKVCTAVKILLDSSDELSLGERGLHKKQIYLYLREITGLNTKQIVSILEKVRKSYRIHNQNHRRSEIV